MPHDDAVSKVLELLTKEMRWTYLSYGERDGFERLWGLSAGHPPAPEEAMNGILIDWNGVPYAADDGRRIADFTTPLDWALATAYEAMERNPDTFEMPRIVIVDRQSHAHATSFAVEMSAALIEALAGYLTLISMTLHPDADPMALRTLLQTPHAGAPARRPRQGQLRALQQAWIGYTVQSRDHHDLNNLIGPLAFAAPGDERGQETDPVPLERRALLQMIRRLGLLDPRNLDASSGWVKPHPLLDFATNNEPVHAVLLDDQAEQWSGFLRQALGPKLQIHQESRPDSIVTAAFAALSEKDPFKRTIQIAQNDANNPKSADQIVFIDLRLFKDGREEEREFYKNLCNQLINHVDDFELIDESGLFSPFLTEDERKLLGQEIWSAAQPLLSKENCQLPFAGAVKRILDYDDIRWSSIRESALYEHLLTLLPRILAHILYTSPIILFSSTGRRDLTEHFRHHQNIVTSFEKPRLQASFDATRRGLRDALDWAYHMLRARRALRALREHVVNVINPNDIAGDNFHYIELFIDETFPENSQNRNVVVGGIYAIHSGRTRDEALAAGGRFDDILVKKGYSYYSRGNYGPTPGAQKIKRKGESGVNELQAALKDAKGSRVGCLRMKLNRSGDPAANDFSGDDTYRTALSSLVEIFLYDLTPARYASIGADKIGVSLFIATRMASFSNYTEARSLAFHWGFHFLELNPDYLVESTGRYSVFNLLNGLHDLRGQSMPIERAVGVRMIYDRVPRYNGDQRLRGQYRISLQENGFGFCTKCRIQIKIRQSAGNMKINMESVCCPVCGKHDNVRPDYPSGMYVADEVISEHWDPMRGYQDVIRLDDLGFDETLDAPLVKLIDASRSADRGENVRAARLLISLYEGEVGLDRSVSTPMRKRMLGKAMGKVGSINREEFWQLSEHLRIFGV